MTPAPKEQTTQNVGVAVIGGSVAGLSAFVHAAAQPTQERAEQPRFGARSHVLDALGLAATARPKGVGDFSAYRKSLPVTSDRVTAGVS